MTKKKRRKRDVKDLAAELVKNIRLLAEGLMPQMEWKDLKTIQDSEKGAGRRAMRYIRRHFTPKDLGLERPEPKDDETHPGAVLAGAIKGFYAVGKKCPHCRKGVIGPKRGKSRGTACNACGKGLTILKSAPGKTLPNRWTVKYLRRLHKGQVLSRWDSLNYRRLHGKEPPRFAAAA